MLDPRGEGPCASNAVRAEAMPRSSSSASKCALHRRRVRADQQERQHPQRAAAQSGFGLQRQRHAPFGIRAEGEDPRAGGIRPRRPRMQFGQAPVQRPARAQRLGGSKCAAANTRSQSAARGAIRARSRARPSASAIAASGASASTPISAFGEFQREQSGRRRASVGGGRAWPLAS